MKDPGKLGTRYSITRNLYNVVGSGPFLVAKADPARVYIFFGNVSAADIVLEPVADFLLASDPANFPKGLVLVAGEHIKFKLSDDGMMVQSEWYAWDATGVPQSPGSTNLIVFEQIDNKPGEC